MQLTINLQKVKMIYTPQGEYIKTLEPYKYMCCRLPEEYKTRKEHEHLFLEIDEEFYKENKLERFEDEFLK